MTRHFNPSIVNRAQRILNSKGNDYLSDEVTGPVAVIPLDHVARIAKFGSCEDATSGTVWTTPPDKDFYLTNAMLVMVKDALATTTEVSMRCQVDGVLTRIVAIPCIGLTAATHDLTVTFNPALKCDRNTVIQIITNSATAKVKAFGTIQGYVEEVTQN
jgi:hypothetical protein